MPRTQVERINLHKTYGPPHESPAAEGRTAAQWEPSGNGDGGPLTIRDTRMVPETGGATYPPQAMVRALHSGGTRYLSMAPAWLPTDLSSVTTFAEQTHTAAAQLACRVD